jgi:hypothetical protein
MVDHMKTSTKRALGSLAEKARGMAREMNDFAASGKAARPAARVSDAVVADVAAFLNQVNPTRVRPVKLQVNQTGAWRNVVSFDASKQGQCAEVLSAAEKLADAVRATMRVVIDDGSPSPIVLLRWSSIDDGWKDAR